MSVGTKTVIGPRLSGGIFRHGYRCRRATIGGLAGRRVTTTAVAAGGPGVDLQQTADTARFAQGTEGVARRAVDAIIHRATVAARCRLVQGQAACRGAVHLVGQAGAGTVARIARAGGITTITTIGCARDIDRAATGGLTRHTHKVHAQAGGAAIARSTINRRTAVTTVRYGVGRYIAGVGHGNSRRCGTTRAGIGRITCTNSRATCAAIGITGTGHIAAVRIIRRQRRSGVTGSACRTGGITRRSTRTRNRRLRQIQGA